MRPSGHKHSVEIREGSICKKLLEHSWVVAERYSV